MYIENGKLIRVRDILSLEIGDTICFCTDSLNIDSTTFMILQCDHNGDYNISSLTNYFLDQMVTDIAYTRKNGDLLLTIEVLNSNPYTCDDCKYYCDGYCKFVPDSEYDEKIEGPRKEIKHDDLLKGCECWHDIYVSGLYRSEWRQ